MKNTVFFLIAILLGVFTAKAQTQIDTLFYDQNWKGVEISSFATYGIITLTPENPVYPKRCRCFNWLTKKLVFEGSFENIDPIDAKKTIYTGPFIEYYENGKIKSSRNYSNGKYNGLVESFYENGNKQVECYVKDEVLNGTIISYYENGQVQESGEMQEGKKNGTFQFYYENGKQQAIINYLNDEIDGRYVTLSEAEKPIQDGEIHDGLFTGSVYSYDESGNLLSHYSIKEDKLDGPSFQYYPNGSIAVMAKFKDDVRDGESLYYAQDGTVTTEENYSNGLLSGACVVRDGMDIRKNTYKILIPSDGSFGVTATVFSNNYSVEKDVKVYLEKKKQVFAELKRNEKIYHVIEFSLGFLNNTKNMIPCSVTDIRIEFINKGKASENMALTEESAVALYQAYGTKATRDAYTHARNTAQRAATYSSNSSTGGYTGTSTYGTSKTYSAGSTVASAVGGVLAGNNAGGVAGAVGAVGAVSSSVGGSSTVNRNYTSSSSSSYAKSTQRDGTVEYQVYQQERQKADQVYEDAKGYVQQRASAAECSSFIAPANDITFRIILGSKMSTTWNSKKYDTIRLSCVINGQECLAEWSIDEFE